MPLPVGQIAVFTAITVPYVILLTLFGLPFSHTLFWLYVLPPGVLTWLATRPVLESKRLPELIISQVRYLGEPSAWCRMTPHVEKDEMLVTGRVWRRSLPEPAVEPSAVPAVEPAAVPAVEPSAVPAVEPAAVPAVGPAAIHVVARLGERAGRRPVPAAEPGRERLRATGPGRAAGAAPGGGQPQGDRANGHGSAPAAFGASGRSTPPTSAPAKTPAPASPARATPAASASAPASANTRTPATPPAATSASAPAAAAPAAPAAPASAPTPAPTKAPVPADLP